MERAFAMHHVSCNMNMREAFLVRSPHLTGVRIGHRNVIHHTGLFCLHKLSNGTTEVGREGWGRGEKPTNLLFSYFELLRVGIMRGGDYSYVHGLYRVGEWLFTKRDRYSAVG